jgi:2-polyprenyl-3-methyl-5-hydroxy-6-metoxy-1,4-benzoquinol methylase
MIYFTYLLNKHLLKKDPVNHDYAISYSTHEFENFDQDLLDLFLSYFNNIDGKNILDLGAGPGQFSIKFLEYNANVTWFDLSNNYLNIFLSKLNEYNFNSNKINYKIGYLDDINGNFDIVFNRICWNYCLNDLNFAKKIYSITNYGGAAFLIINNEQFFFNSLIKYNFLKKNILIILHFLNDYFNIKLNHSFISHRKLFKIFSNFQFTEFKITYYKNNTLIYFIK